jgi:hypothetical protein
MLSRPSFPKYAFKMSDKLALLVGCGFFALGGFAVFVLLPSGITGLYVREGWAQILSGLLVLLVLMLIATSNIGKAILIVFSSLGGIVSIVSGFSNSSDPLLVLGVVLFLVTYFLYSMMEKD